MKRNMLGTLAVGAMLLDIGTQAYAGTFTFKDATHGVYASGWVNTDNGVATFGTITVTGNSGFNGTYSLYAGDSTGNVQTSSSGKFVFDNLFNAAATGPDSAAGLLWSNGTTEVNMWANSTGLAISAYSGGADWIPAGVSGWGFNSTESTVGVPDGGMTAMLLGMGMVGLGWVRRSVKQ